MFDTLENCFVNNSVNFENPRHSTYSQEVQYRVKVQTYTSLPCEISVQRYDCSRVLDAYHSLYERGLAHPKRRSGERKNASVNAENVERATRRAKTKCRQLVCELAPTAFVTFTTRRVYSVDVLASAWSRFTRSLHSAGVEFAYVAVPERHPKNPAHLHLHAAYRGRVSINLLRRLWHIALEAIEGRVVKKTLYGSESPGNIDVQRVAAKSSYRRMRKIAKYISKYLTKDVIVVFNKKRYWPSKGIKLETARVYWLESLTMPEALREGLLLLGLLNPDGQPCQYVFNPSDRIAWLALEPEKMPDPF